MSTFRVLSFLAATLLAMSGCSFQFFTQVPETVAAGDTAEVVVVAHATGVGDATSILHGCVALPTDWASPTLSIRRASVAEPLAATADGAFAAEVEGRHPVAGVGASWRCFTTAPQTASSSEGGSVVASITIPADAQGIVPIVTHGAARSTPGGSITYGGFVEQHLRVGVAARDTFDAWTAPEWKGGGSAVWGLRYGGGRFVGVVASDLLVSTDGLSWSSFRLLTNPGDLAFGAGSWILVDEGKLHTISFPDGDADPEVDAIPGLGTGFSRVVYGNGRFVAAGHAGAIATSVDGVTWVPASVGEESFFSIIASDGAGFLASSYSQSWVSSDGLRWSPIAPGIGPIYYAAFGNGRWIASTPNAMLESTDGGQSWATISSPSSRMQGSSTPVVAFVDGRFLLGGSAGTSGWLFAGSGTSGWVPVRTGFSGAVSSFAQSESLVVAGGERGFIGTAPRRPSGPPVIESIRLPVVRTHWPYSATIDVASGSGLVTLSLESGSLPAGLSLERDVIVGMTEEVGTHHFAIAATDEKGARDQRSFTLEVEPGPPSLPDTFPPVRAGEVTLRWLEISYGFPPFQFEVVQPPAVGELHAALHGRELEFSIEIDEPGVTQFRLRVTDSKGLQDERQYEIRAVEPPEIEVPGVLPPAVIGRPYSQSFYAIGAGPFTWRMLGDPPQGLRMEPGDDILVLAGPVTDVEGIYEFTLELTDAAGWVVELEQSLEVVEPPSLSRNAFPAAVVGDAYEVEVVASGGRSPYVWTADSPLPEGLAWVPSDDRTILSGTPTEAGSFSQTIVVRDDRGVATVLETTLVVGERPKASAPTLDLAIVGEAFEARFEASRGTTPYAFSFTGELPPGLSLTTDSDAGLLAGVPEAAGNFDFWVTVTDAKGLATKFPLSTLVVVTRPAFLTAATLPEAEQGKAYSATIDVSGGTAPLSWSHEGALPEGLAFDEGILAGTPIEDGEFTFTVRVVDANQLEASRQFTLEVVAPGTDDPKPGKKAKKKSSGGCAATGGASLLPLAWIVVLARLRRRS